MPIPPPAPEGKCQVLKCLACNHIFVWSRFGRATCPQCPDRARCNALRNSDGTVWFTLKVAREFARQLRQKQRIRAQTSRDLERILGGVND